MLPGPYRKAEHQSKAARHFQLETELWVIPWPLFLVEDKKEHFPANLNKQIDHLEIWLNDLQILIHIYTSNNG